MGTLPPSLRESLLRGAHEVGMPLQGAPVCMTSSRWCLSVEHGDYNGTELFGVGVDRFLCVAFRPVDEPRVRLFSTTFPDQGVVDFWLHHLPPPGAVELRGLWARFPMGVAFVLRREGVPLTRGIEAVIASQIPGGGMSRSASLTINLMLCLLHANGVAPPPPLTVARWAQAVENEYVGSPCGLLDQVMILFARQGQGVHYAPRRDEVVHVPLPPHTPPFRLVMLDTGTRREGLETSTYVVRRQECQTLVRMLNERGFPVRTLAEVGPEAFGRITALTDIPPPLRKRLSYIFHAQRRFPLLLEAWRRGDIPTVGSLFRLDGFGLRDEYEISGPELEAMCEIARGVPGVWGERMLGGGDKGASGAIASPEAVSPLREAVAREYPRRFPHLAGAWRVEALQTADGVTWTTLS